MVYNIVVITVVVDDIVELIAVDDFIKVLFVLLIRWVVVNFVDVLTLNEKKLISIFILFY